MTIFVVTLSFLPARLLQKSLRAFYATRNHELPIRHALLDQHYPIDKVCNRKDVRSACAEFGIECWDAGRNLGLHDGFNWVLRSLRPKDDDIVIGYDGDSMPVDLGWDMALVRAIQGSNGSVVWSSLMNPRSRGDLNTRRYDARLIDGYLEAWATRTSVTNSICAWRVGWLRDVGWLQEPIRWYGHLESTMWRHLQATAKEWVFLPGWRETDELRNQHDRSYILYKWQLSHQRSTSLDFESWLIAKGYDLTTGLHPCVPPEGPEQIP